MNTGDIVIPEGMKDIKPPVDIVLSHPWWYYAFFILLLFLLVFLAFILVRKFFCRNIKDIDAEIVILPEKNAFDRIDALEAKFNSFEMKDKKEIWFILSDILKDYVKIRFCIDLRCADESEIMESVSRVFPEARYENFKNIMNKLASLKFSNFSPDDDEVFSMIEEIKNFINSMSDFQTSINNVNGGKDELQV